MPGIGDVPMDQVWHAALQGLSVGGVVALAGVGFGIWDRRMKARGDRVKEQQEGMGNASKQETAWREELRGERDAERKLRKEVEARCEALENEKDAIRDKAEERVAKAEEEKDRVWFAARRMEGFAHNLWHIASNLLMIVREKLGIEREDLPPVPNLVDLLKKPDPPAA